MSLTREKNLWNQFLTATSFLLTLLLPIFILIDPAFGSTLNTDNTKTNTLRMKYRDMYMSKIDPDVHLLIRAKCNQVLKNMDGYICYDYKAKSPRFNVYIIDKKVNEVNLKKRLDFRPDSRIPLKFRDPIKCFKHNDYDLGHLEPDADVDYNKSALMHTYLMSNIVPQPSYINRVIIANWEKFERYLTYTGKVVVITGADYYKNGYLNDDPFCSKIPKDFYKVLFVFSNITHRYEPFLVLFTRNNDLHKTYVLRSRTDIQRFLRKRKIYYYGLRHRKVNL